MGVESAVVAALRSVSDTIKVCRSVGSALEQEAHEPALRLTVESDFLFPFLCLV